MTREEHIARCMLLGAKYIERFGYYLINNGDTTYTRLDAVTLEKVTMDEVQIRQMNYNERGNWRRYKSKNWTP